jgi:hypothetical protein
MPGVPQTIPIPEPHSMLKLPLQRFTHLYLITSLHLYFVVQRHSPLATRHFFL